MTFLILIKLLLINRCGWHAETVDLNVIQSLKKRLFEATRHLPSEKWLNEN